ncbi:hypothetical protein P12x_005618 [Tundrisphaera lichenicola]|uniref:hypothetical protein n=1 Tax=Tundrisphaera lichenicola TaxID=2029860 RepID=UPI003EB6F77F
MEAGHQGGFRLFLAWMFFPLIPALLGQACSQALGFWRGVDPRDWGWAAWLIQLGPLLGFGYLAGATLDLPDDPEARKGWGRLSRRWAWVAIGPWVGFISAVAILYTWSLVASALRWASITVPWSGSPFPPEPLIIALLGWIAYGWLIVAWVVRLRAVRRGRAGRSFANGLTVALLFVGSLFGTFWAATEIWRDYFFDRRVVPILLIACLLIMMAGCSGTVTYGEVRRRELFQALLLAWLLGLGLGWRWWSRSRSKPT